MHAQTDPRDPDYCIHTKHVGCVVTVTPPPPDIALRLGAHGGRTVATHAMAHTSSKEVGFASCMANAPYWLGFSCVGSQAVAN